MKNERLHWHPAFYAALQIEFEREEEQLVFHNEHQLGKKPMAIDVVIIKPRKGIKLKKKIGCLFKQHNIVEYKSPEDYLSINDYYKVLGYACFYQSDTSEICQISPEEVTLTFVCSYIPQKLRTHLNVFQNIEMEEVGPGIYYLRGSMFPTQILVTRQLSKTDNVWLSRMRTDLSVKDDLDPLSRAYREKRKDPRYEAVMDLLIRANYEKVEEVKEMCEAIRELFADEYKEAETKGVEKGIEKGIEVLILDNLEEEKTKEQILEKLIKRFSLSRKDADKYLKRYVPG